MLEKKGGINMLKEYLKKIKWESLFTALFAVVIGILFLCFPDSSSLVLCYAGGSIFIALGVIYCVRYLFSERIFGSYIFIFSLLLIVLGIFCLVKPNTIKAIITIIFGLFLLVDGIVKMQEGIELSRAYVKGWWSVVALGIITIALGVVVMFGTFENVMIFAGVSLIVDGICDAVTTLVFSSKIRKAEKEIRAVIDDQNDK